MRGFVATLEQVAPIQSDCLDVRQHASGGINPRVPGTPRHEPREQGHVPSDAGFLVEPVAAAAVDYWWSTTQRIPEQEPNPVYRGAQGMPSEHEFGVRPDCGQ